jgi:hypothetical protein
VTSGRLTERQLTILGSETHDPGSRLGRIAAAEIRELQADNSRLRPALQGIADWVMKRPPEKTLDGWVSATEKMFAALE